jgi:hypothetical protein
MVINQPIIENSRTNKNMYTYTCPECGKIKNYKRKSAFVNAVQSNSICSPCKFLIKHPGYYKEYDIGYRLENNDNIREYQKKWNLENKEYKKEYQRKYSLLNKDTIREERKEYYIKNKAEIKAQRKGYYKEYCSNRKKYDPIYKIKCSARSLILNSFKRRGFKKNGKTFKILGCPYEKFESYMISKFKPGMTLENHGLWEIDHIIPLSTANTYEEVEKLCYYTNLQPLWKEDNRKKSDKI